MSKHGLAAEAAEMHINYCASEQGKETTLCARLATHANALSWLTGHIAHLGADLQNRTAGLGHSIRQFGRAFFAGENGRRRRCRDFGCSWPQQNRSTRLHNRTRNAAHQRLMLRRARKKREAAAAD